MPACFYCDATYRPCRCWGHCDSCDAPVKDASRCERCSRCIVCGHDEAPHEVDGEHYCDAHALELELEFGGERAGRAA